MGKEILPFIGEIYESNLIGEASESSALILHGLPMLLREVIENEYVLPKEIRGNMPAIRDFTAKWLLEI